MAAFRVWWRPARCDQRQCEDRGTDRDRASDSATEDSESLEETRGAAADTPAARAERQRGALAESEERGEQQRS